jgi:hypothetical protein
MLNQTQIIIKSTIKNYEDEKSVVPETLINLRIQVREQLEQRFINSKNKHLPFIDKVGEVQTIDKETIISIDSSTSIEERGLLMNEVINHSNYTGNLLILVNNSSTQVREYINNILNSYHTRGILEENSLELIGNITLYHISNIVLNEIGVDQIMESYREAMFVFNNEQAIPRIREDIIVDYKTVLSNQGLLNEEQLTERVEDFYKGVNQREETFQQERLIQSRKKIMMVGGGILISMALSSLGIPSLVSGMLGRNILSSFDSSIITQSISTSENIRLRDIYDKLLLNIFKKIN